MRSEEAASPAWGSWRTTAGADGGEAAASSSRSQPTVEDGSGAGSGTTSRPDDSWWRSRSWSESWYQPRGGPASGHSGGWSWGWSQPTEDAGKEKDRDDEVPGWDGKSVPIQTYFRSIDIWLAGTRMAPERRGVKLLGKLTGDAFEKMELVNPLDLKFDGGVDKFRELILAKYDPINSQRVGRIMDDFVYHLERKPEEEINGLRHKVRP